MLRVHCTVQDLLTVSIAEHPAPLLELSVALCMLQRRDAHPAFDTWRHRVGRTLPLPGRAMLELTTPTGAGPMFLDPITPSAEEGLDLVLSTSTDRARDELERVCATGRPVTGWIRRLADRDREAWQILRQALHAAFDTVIFGSWARLRTGFAAEIAWRTRVLARTGLRSTLIGLGPGMTWRDMVLHIDYPREVDVFLHGRGIILQPSLFWTGNPLAHLPADGPMVLVYPATTPLPLLDSPKLDDPLTALLGSTRAQALRTLVTERTTSDLARDLAVTTAAASMQAKILREAGLIMSQREGKAVWHRCTPLGVDLITAGLTVA